MDKLLEILSENSSFTTKELAMMLGEQEESISARIKEYEKSGVIKGYHAIVDWTNVPDAGVTALIELKVTPQKETGFDYIAQCVMEFEEVETLSPLKTIARGESIIHTEEWTMFDGVQISDKTEEALEELANKLF